jgi:hypothetical protein
MNKFSATLVASLLLWSLVGQSALAASPAVKFSNQGAFALYDRGDATVYISGTTFSGASPFAMASFSIVDNSTSESLVSCQSISPSVSVSPSGHTEVKFSPQADALCPSGAPILLTCEPEQATVISSSTYNLVTRGGGQTQVGHNVGWNMYGLRCSIEALGVEYQTAGNAYLTNYLSK